MTVVLFMHSKSPVRHYYEREFVFTFMNIFAPGLFEKLRQGIYYEMGDEQQSKVRNIVIDW